MRDEYLDEMSYMFKKKKIVKTAKHLVLNTVLSLLKQSDFQAVRVVLN